METCRTCTHWDHTRWPAVNQGEDGVCCAIRGYTVEQAPLEQHAWLSYSEDADVMTMPTFGWGVWSAKRTDVSPQGGTMAQLIRFSDRNEGINMDHVIAWHDTGVVLRLTFTGLDTSPGHGTPYPYVLHFMGADREALVKYLSVVARSLPVLTP
jgi:hypothetical protein